MHPQAPQSPAAQVPKAASLPEPVPEPPQSTAAAVAPPPSTPPPSPETPHPQAATPPAPQREVNVHQEPEENSESDIQDVSGDNGVILEPSHPVEQCETNAPCRTDPLQTTPTIEDRRPQSPSPTQINSDVTDGSSYPTLTPKKPPVQDTMTHVDKALAAVVQPAETSQPPTTQVKTVSLSHFPTYSKC